MRDESDLPGALGAAAALVSAVGLVVAVGFLPPAVFYMGLGAVAVASASLVRHRGFLWSITAVVVVADAAGLALGHEAGLGYLLAVLAALATAAVGDLWIASVRALAVTRQEIEREMTARRHEAEEITARKHRFLAAVSHDIRTPANAIRLHAALIRRRASEPATMSEVPRLTHQLEESAASLVALVSDMLDLTRMDGDGVDLTESAFELDATIDAECVALRPLGAESGAALIHVPAARPIWMYTDRVKLARIVRNLLENGLKFTPGGEVRVATSIAADGRIRIDVVDTGAGIAAADVRDIFDEFVQLRNPERNRGKGTGLGLAICKRLVEVMGGAIDVESILGEGSRFIVHLPAVAAIPVPDDGRLQTEPAISLAGIRVVMAEDHDLTRVTCTALLRGEGAAVSEARDGVEALALIDSVRPQVLLLDLMMPRLDGVGVLRRLRDARPAPLQAVIVVSGDRRADATDEMRELGADAVITKPIDPSRLVHLLRGMTGRLQASR